MLHLVSAVQTSWSPQSCIRLLTKIVNRR